MIDSIPGPLGQLEALFHEPRGLAEGEAPRAIAVVCHPHPAHQGNMNSTVTFKIARGLQEAGVACLRINFRGVGKSDGEYDGNGGEEDDARAAIDWLAAKFPNVQIWAAGFSFGSRTVFGLAKRDASIERLILVGFPVRAYPLEGVDTLERPALFVWGTDDEYGTLRDLRAEYPELPDCFEFEELEGIDHFFRRATKELEAIITAYARRA
ncbi:MAG: alpha/beta superfamily hydrolase [Planctomycetota bacterium]|jgi:alpha/beta superfamily hydrolase